MSTASNPPRGDYQKAEKYISQLAILVEQNKLEVVHTDLNRFDPSTIQDHYRLDLNDYQIEISHSKLPNSGADSYVMLFTNLKNVVEGNANKTILAYTQLSDTQFHKFKTAADAQLEERRQKEEEKRFNDALSPIDSLLDDFGNKSSQPDTPPPIHHAHHHLAHDSTLLPKENSHQFNGNDFSFYKSKGITIPEEEKLQEVVEDSPEKQLQPS